MSQGNESALHGEKEGINRKEVREVRTGLGEGKRWSVNQARTCK